MQDEVELAGQAPVRLADHTSFERSDQGECTRINVGGGSWECHWITFLKGGAITVEGPLHDGKSSVLPITGGRGKFNDASGSMALSALAIGVEYDFVFTVRQ
jgi:hypothetical protein